ncbi:hypothetical protein [Streptomyces sp. NPDC001315]|uniref:hypothetical protein n=1 Tax=Streptomyces sp. NPDC001315 TaxID=3364562 RepID=UPI0036A9D04F
MPTPIAPFVSAFRRRLANLPGPGARAGGEASNDQPVVIEMWVRGAWVDITSYCMVRDDSGRVDITTGIRTEGQQADQAEARLQLKNGDGRFSPRNPAGPYYGAIGRNTPMRISVPDGNGGKTYVIWGDVTQWAPNWDTTGNSVWVDITISGPIRRLAQAPAPARSVLYRSIAEPAGASLRAYWPVEDASGSKTIVSPLTSGSPMTFTGTPTLAGFDGFAASDPVVLMAGNVLTGGVANYSNPTMTQVRFLCTIPAEGLSDGKVICSIDQEDYAAGSPQFWELFYTTTGNTLWLRQNDSDGNLLGIELQHTLDVRGRRLYVSVEMQESGANISRAIRLYDLTDQIQYDASDTAFVSALTRVTRVQFGPASRSAVGPTGTSGLTNVAIGHVTVEDTITPLTVLGVHLNPVGERAGRRIQRVCAEAAIPFQWIGDLDDTTAMGNQGKLNPLELMREAEAADGGMLYEAAGGLAYRTRVSLCNQDPQLVLDYTAFNLSEIPTPIEDDRYIQNQVSVTAGDATATYSLDEGSLSIEQPPTGVGVYGANITLNLGTSESPLSHAAWRVHMGTVDEPRYPQISVNLAHTSFVNNPDLERAVLNLRQGDRILVQNPPTWLPPGAIDQVILGVERALTHFEHRITFVCAPASPYRVGVTDTVLAVIDTDGSALVEDATPTATALTVAPSAGQSGLWTTDSANLPLDVRVGGEVMRVTNITDWLTDTATRTVASSWGTPDVGPAWSTVGGGSASDYAVNGSALIQTLSTVDVTRRTAVTAVSPDYDVYCDITTSALALGDSLYGAVTGRMLDAANMYMARLEFTTSNTIILVVRKLIADTGTDLGTYMLPVTHVAGQFVRVRFQGVGTQFRAKAWLATDPVEPPDWHVTGTDSSISPAYTIGTRSIRVTGNTNAATVAIQYDNYRVVRPQTFTVTRSVNGVVKAQLAGEDLRLAYPTIVSL